MIIGAATGIGTTEEMSTFSRAYSKKTAGSFGSNQS